MCLWCVMLLDPRVGITVCDNDDHSPLWMASWNGKIEVIEWLFASGRDLGDINKMGQVRHNESALVVVKRNE